MKDKEILAFGSVLLLVSMIMFLFSSCSAIKPLIESEEIQTEYFEFDDFARKIHHINDREGYTASLNWADVRALNIDSVTAKYIEYSKYHLRIKTVYR